MPGKISLQFKFGLSYILVILAVLLLLNTYPLLVSQNLVFLSLIHISEPTRPY